MPCILNAANEVVNQAFRDGRCSFPRMAEVIGETMQRVSFDASPTLDAYFQTDREARKVAAEQLICF